MALKGNELVEKRNALNEASINKMGVQELRFFSIYLAKINARDKSTRLVRFPLADFVKIMELQKVNISAIKETTTRLLRHVVNIPISKSGGYTAFQLFKKCKVDKDDDENWYVEIDAHDDALPLMFDLKGKYFSYRLGNVLRLSSTNQINLYNQLKQYEFIGQREMSITQLRKVLEVTESQYSRWDRFRASVLIPCQRALAEHTDICFTFKPVQRGRNHETIAVTFFITSNPNYIDQLTLAEFIDMQTIDDDVDDDVIGPQLSGEYTGINYPFLAEAFDNEFTLAEVEHLYLFSLPYIQTQPNFERDGAEISTYNYFNLKYSLLKAKSKMVKSSRYGFLKSLIEADLKTLN